jgi:hypothetical protein
MSYETLYHCRVGEYLLLLHWGTCVCEALFQSTEYLREILLVVPPSYGRNALNI